MHPAPFDYAAASSVEEAIALLQQHGEDAKVLAGGHSLIPLMKLRLAAPALLVDIDRISALRGVESADGTVRIGALTTYTALLDSAESSQSLPLLVETAGHVGDTQVRNRGTVGGSIAHADPAGDLPAALLALDASLSIQGPSGARTVAATEFIQGPFTTDLQPDEVLTGVEIRSLPPRTGTAYEKVRNPASGYAVVGIAAVVTLDERGAIAASRVAITGAGSQPMRATALEEQLGGTQADEEGLTAAAAAVTDGLDLVGDAYASADYRAHLARVHARRALLRALERARA